MTKYHRWTMEEEKLCAEEYVKGFIENSLDFDEVAKTITLKAPVLKFGSVKMRLSNIKYILANELNIKDNFFWGQLSNYASKTRIAIISVLKEKGYY